MTTTKRTKRTAKRRASGGISLWVWIVVGAVILVILALAFAPSGGGESEQREPAPAGSVEIAREPGPALEPGEAIPAWSAPALDGSGDMEWDSYVGEPTVLTIWAPWCPHCQAELPRLSAAVEDHPDVQMVTITSAVDQGSISSQEFLDSEGLTFPVAVDDAARTLMQGFGATTTPTTYFVDSNGDVMTAVAGEMEPAQLEEILTELEGR